MNVALITGILLLTPVGSPTQPPIETPQTLRYAVVPTIPQLPFNERKRRKKKRK